MAPFEPTQPAEGLFNALKTRKGSNIYELSLSATNASASDTDYIYRSAPGTDSVPTALYPHPFDTTRDGFNSVMPVSAWEQSFSNPSSSATTWTSAADTFWDNLNLDPTTFNLGDYGFTGEEYGDGAEELEYIGPPTEYPSMALPIPRGIDSDIHSFADYGDLPGLVNSSGFGLSQALPRLPPPPTSPPHTELEETDAVSYTGEHGVIAKGIQLLEI
ncbi:hypothetical protein B0H14DRAFT_2570103 [Mycena olivaceomarginata]|nr:hypothetical protein B0H14DRAFT_2570103 [Mycena olivaceomarginata]